MTTATEAWAVVVGCPGSCLTGRYQLRQSDYEAEGYYLQGSSGCKIVEPDGMFGESGITHKLIYGAYDEVPLKIGILAVTWLNAGIPAPLNLKVIEESL
jgi:hypothetical protein